MGYRCIICNKEITGKNQYIASHVKKIHGIDFNDYIKMYYVDITVDFKEEMCGFCEKPAIYTFEIDNINKTYKKIYKKGYWCGTDICRNNISLEILGHGYTKKTYEHIGSKKEYISKLHKISITESKKRKTNLIKKKEEKSKCTLNGYILRHGIEIGTIKYKERCDKISNSNKKEWYIGKYGELDGNIKWTEYLKKIDCSLNGYVLRYGIEIGTIKYKERCDKISKTSKKEWYIDKYGELDGNKKWNIYIDKIRKNNRKNKSKTSTNIEKHLTNLGISYIEEYCLKDINKYCDYYIPEYNTIIEFYGDYWHCNPKIYDMYYYHQYIKKTAIEIWDNDKKRLYDIYKYLDQSVSILVIWESSIMNKDFLIKILNDNKNKNNIIYV